MVTNTQAPPGEKRRQYYTGDIFSLKKPIRLEFNSPRGDKKEVFETRGPFCVTGMCMDRARTEDESYDIVLTDHDHPGWTTEIPMDIIVSSSPKNWCLGRFLNKLRR